VPASKKPADAVEISTDKLEVTMECGNHKETRTKDILVRYDPLIFLIPGLWFGEHDYDPVRESLNNEYSNHFFFFDYEETNSHLLPEQKHTLQCG